MSEVETEKERLLTYILSEVIGSCIIMPYAQYYQDKPKLGGAYVDWFEGKGKVKVGDLVYCNTIRDTKYKIGYVVKIHDNWHMDIREVGSDNVCSISNEKFYPIRDIFSLNLLEGEEYKIYQKVLKAFRQGDEYMYVFNGIKFPEKRKALINIRKKWSGSIGELETFDVELSFSSKTSIKQVLSLMIEQGYGSKFERKLSE